MTLGFFLARLHPKQAFQLLKILYILKCFYSFLMLAHLAIVRKIEKILFFSVFNSALKIRSFLSFKIDQRIEKGINRQRIEPPPLKGSPLQAFINSLRPLGIHHEIEHFLIKKSPNISSGVTMHEQVIDRFFFLPT